MSKSSRAVAIAALSLVLPLAALADTTLNLDTGATGSSGGDIVFNPGVSIAPQGSAGFDDLTPSASAEFAYMECSVALKSFTYKTTPISGAHLAQNEVFVVHTNGGNYAAVELTAVSSTSVTLQYETCTGATAKVQQASGVTLGGPGAPTIGAVTNNYSAIYPNAPNYGIAPGALIVIWGSNLAAAGGPTTLQNPSNPLPQTLSGSSVSVTVGGKTVQPGFYYASPTQLDVVLPSNTPVGTGTITVNYNGQNSAAFPLKVVASAFGFDVWGGALAAVTDNQTGALITASNSAKPGETVVFWGAGLGADTANTDLGPPKDFHNIANSLTAFYLGSVQVSPSYYGRSPYQGVDQINLTIPSNAPTGCAVSVSAVSGSVVSNFVSLPIAANGGTCVDPLAYVSPAEATILSGKSAVKFGYVSIGQMTEPNSTGTGTTTIQSANAEFLGISGASLTSYESSTHPSLGSCFVTQSNSLTAVNPYAFTGLDAGSISVQGPNGTQTLTKESILSLFIYSADPLPSGFIPSSGGTFTFNNGSGGPDVGSFSTGVAMPPPLVWTNASSDGTVNRSSGVTVNWTGGGGTGYVDIAGSSVSTSAVFSATFVCLAPVSAGTFTVPPPVLLALPAGTGALMVSNYTTPVDFSASGLDYAFGEAFTTTDIQATYN